jgi:protein-S-isoprenylcysteine O-methyltransferase Ste14
MRPLPSAILLFVVFLALLLGRADRLEFPFLYAYVGIILLAGIVFRLTADPDLQQERTGPGSGKKGLGFRLAVMPFVLAHLAIAGLDMGRFHWSRTIPLAVRITALIGVAAGLGLVLWAMAVNRFFSPAVRIQQERGHEVISSGPYGLVRHPGYLGMMVAALCSGPALGSWWAIVPIAGYVLLILLRVVVEDRFLHRELGGYAQYAKRVRFRLIPGVW